MPIRQLMILALMNAVFLFQSANAAAPIQSPATQGGLVVVVGCDDPAQLVSLRGSNGSLVQGIDRDLKNVAAAQKALHEKNAYGPVSVRHWSGERLPYIDNLVGTLIINGKTSLDSAEILRVLRPRGVALVGGKTIVKPVPAEIDDWTHYFHGPDNNSLAKDTVVAPPRRFQWRSNPVWGRNHSLEKNRGQPTVMTVLSAAGRLFILMDRVETSVMSYKPVYGITARDAFSGVDLWSVPIETVGFQKDYSATWRRFVVDEERVYTAFGKEGELRALDALTGKQVWTYKGTTGLDELIKANDTLFVLLKAGTLLALNAKDGKEIWRQSVKPEPLTLATMDGRVFFKSGQSLVCLSAATGKTVYNVDLPGATKIEDSPLKGTLYYPGKLLAGEGVVLCTYGAKDPMKLRGWKLKAAPGVGNHRDVKGYGGRLGAFSAKNGTLLWEMEYLPNLQTGPGEMYINEGTAWIGPVFDKPRDLQTGKIKADRPIVDKLWTDGHHYRCYPGKATSRYLITAKRGIEMFDLKGNNHSRDNWVRGNCGVGVTPANGLIYAPPHSCGCYMESLLYGFYALAGAHPAGPVQPVADASRILKGPAYGAVKFVKSTDPLEWPTYRRDTMRGGSTPVRLTANLKMLWQTQLPGKPTALTVASGRVYAADSQSQSVYALDPKTGATVWSFTAGGPIDSPPTIAGGLVFFGSHDGHVYCLRAKDGALVWRFLAASNEEQGVDSDRCESVWPVYGTVVFNKGLIYAAAGRSSFLDKGITVYALNPLTGQIVHKKVVATNAEGFMEPPADARKYQEIISQNKLDYKTELAGDHSDSFAMGGVLADILTADDKRIYMRNMTFDHSLNEIKDGGPRLYSMSGILDGWEHDRSWWVLGTGNFRKTSVAPPWMVSTSLQVPSGTLLTFNEESVWGVKRDANKNKAKTTLVFGGKRPAPLTLPDFAPRPSIKYPPIKKRERGIRGYQTNWTTDLKIRVRAMVSTGDHLILAGMELKKAFNPIADTQGTPPKGLTGKVQFVDPNTGAVIKTFDLPTPPVWDGLVVTPGRLYVSCIDGTVMAFATE